MDGSGQLGKHLWQGSEHPPFQLSPLLSPAQINLGLSGNPAVFDSYYHLFYMSVVSGLQKVKELIH